MIGVFDSGSGGLTVFHEILPALSAEQDVLYFGDHTHAPYGDRDPDDIYELTKQGVELLFARGAKLVIVACNTAAAVALRRLQQDWLPTAHPTRRVLGVLVPAVEEVTGSPWLSESALPADVPTQYTVGFFATPATVASDAFAHEVHKRNPEIRVVSQACPELVRLIESRARAAEVAAHVQECIDQLQLAITRDATLPLLDTVVLGCTHYPLVEQIFRDRLPGDVRIVSQPALVAQALRSYVARHPEFATAGSSERGFLTSGDAVQATQVASQFFGPGVAFRGVAL